LISIKFNTFSLSFLIILNSSYLLIVGVGFVVAPDNTQWHSDTKLLGLPWTRDRPIAEPSNSQHTTLTRTDIHDPGGIRTRSPNKRAATDPLLRLRDHWDQGL